MHEKNSNYLFRNLWRESKFKYLCFVYMQSVSSVKMEPKSHHSPILVILVIFLVLNTKICTEMVILEA